MPRWPAAPRQFEAVHLRHHEIKQDHVGQFRRDRVERNAAICRAVDRPAPRPDDRARKLPLFAAVFDDEYVARPVSRAQA